MRGPLIFLVQILKVSVVMEIVQDILKEKHPDIERVIELSTVQFADDCTNLVVANTVKLQGIYVDKNYKFNTHTSKTVSKVNQRLAHLAKVKNFLPDRQLMATVEALALSVLY